MIQKLKQRAKRLRRSLAKTHGLTIVHSQALELVAQEENYPNWDAACGSLAHAFAPTCPASADITDYWIPRQHSFRRCVEESLRMLGRPGDCHEFSTPHALLCLEADLAMGNHCHSEITRWLDAIPGMRETSQQVRVEEAHKQLGFLLMG